MNFRWLQQCRYNQSNYIDLNTNIKQAILPIFSMLVFLLLNILLSALPIPPHLHHLPLVIYSLCCYHFLLQGEVLLNSQLDSLVTSLCWPPPHLQRLEITPPHLPKSSTTSEPWCRFSNETMTRPLPPQMLPEPLRLFLASASKSSNIKAEKAKQKNSQWKREREIVNDPWSQLGSGRC